MRGKAIFVFLDRICIFVGCSSEWAQETLKLWQIGKMDFDWGHWGPVWLEKRFLTVGMRVELKSTFNTRISTPCR